MGVSKGNQARLMRCSPMQNTVIVRRPDGSIESRIYCAGRQDTKDTAAELRAKMKAAGATGWKVEVR